MKVEKREIQGVTVFSFRPQPGDDRRDLSQLKELLCVEAKKGLLIVLDLSSVELLKTTVLQLGNLIGIAGMVEISGGLFVVAGLRPNLVELFRMVGLDKVVAYRLDVPEAIAALRDSRASPDSLRAGNPTVAEADAVWKRRTQELRPYVNPANRPKPDIGDWMKVLRIFGELKTLLSRHEIHLYPELSFEKVFALLAESLKRIDDEPPLETRDSDDY